jgi:hypothetical protein
MADGWTQEATTMRYMLLIYGAEGTLDQGQMEQCYKDSTVLAHDLAAAGKLVSTSPLQSIGTATSVRMRGGKRVVTDGPFAETREQLGGYFMVEAADLDEAVAIAARIPGATWGTVEVRPVVELTGLPEA